MDNALAPPANSNALSAYIQQQFRPQNALMGMPSYGGTIDPFQRNGTADDWLDALALFGPAGLYLSRGTQLGNAIGRGALRLFGEEGASGGGLQFIADLLHGADARPAARMLDGIGGQLAQPVNPWGFGLAQSLGWQGVNIASDASDKLANPITDPQAREEAYFEKMRQQNRSLYAQNPGPFMQDVRERLDHTPASKIEAYVQGRERRMLPPEVLMDDN